MKATILSALAAALLICILAVAVIAPRDARSQQGELIPIGARGPLLPVGAGSMAWFLDPQRNIVIECSAGNGAIQCSKTPIP